MQAVDTTGMTESKMTSQFCFTIWRVSEHILLVLFRHRTSTPYILKYISLYRIIKYNRILKRNILKRQTYPL